MGLIDTGKAGYDSVQEFTRRVQPALDGDPVLGPRDLHPYRDDEPEVKFLKPRVSGDILEVGCGFGRMSAQLVPPAESYVGVDPVKAKIEYARKHYDRLETLFQCVPPTGWVLHLKFDFAIFITVLQHLTYPVTLSLLQTAREHLRPGGQILMCEGQFHPTTRAECEAIYARAGHSAHMIPKPLPELCREAGLRYTNHGGCNYTLEVVL